MFSRQASVRRFGAAGGGRLLLIYSEPEAKGSGWLTALKISVAQHVGLLPRLQVWQAADRARTNGIKSGRERIVPISNRMIEKLQRLKPYSLHVQPDDFLLCYDDGTRAGETWRYKRFKTALKRVEIKPGDRWLTPHSFRHTINTSVRNSNHDSTKIHDALGWMDEKIQDNNTRWEAEHLRRWADIVDDIGE